jgi:hypothetical protein
MRQTKVTAFQATDGNEMPPYLAPHDPRRWKSDHRCGGYSTALAATVCRMASMTGARDAFPIVDAHVTAAAVGRFFPTPAARVDSFGP